MEQLDWNFKIPFKAILYGAPRSGKKTLVNHWLKGPLYSMFEPTNIRFVETEKGIKDIMEEQKDGALPVLIILENYKSHMKVVQELFYANRHYNISVILITQNVGAISGLEKPDYLVRFNTEYRPPRYSESLYPFVLTKFYSGGSDVPCNIFGSDKELVEVITNWTL